MDMPRVHWAETADGDSIAYQHLGAGSGSLVLVVPLVNHLEASWERPESAAMLRSLAAFSRVTCFDGPARALKCGQAICGALQPPGLDVRAGCHTGETELLGADVGGIAVHIGARVAALAGPSEVLVSSTVKDLIAGSGLVFEDCGEHALKGVPETWRLYAVAP
jgi:class 3 adenylate cyclase